MKKCDRRYQDIIIAENLLSAWREFFRDKKKRTDAVLFHARLMNNVLDLRRDLLEKTYAHGGYIAFNISDPKPRSIHKASVRDRLLHHLIYQELYRYFDTKFIHDSYSCRLGKGTHKAMDRFRGFGRTVSRNHTRTCWVLKCDIRKFFASIDQDVLKAILEKHIADPDILWLLGRVIDSFETNVEHSVFNKKGLPLGNLTSQLLVNVYMNEFDQYVKRVLKVKQYIRYADDFIILSDDKAYLEKLLPQIADFLQSTLRLSLHPDKVFIKTLASGVDFLGWVHFPHHRVIRTATKRRMWRHMKQSPKKEMLASYTGMLSHGNAYGLQKELNICSTPSVEQAVF